MTPAAWREDGATGEVLTGHAGDLRRPDSERRFNVHVRKRWVLVAEYLSNGQETARWFRDRTGDEVRPAGDWYTAESWKRPNTGVRLNAHSVAYITGLLTSEELAKING